MVILVVDDSPSIRREIKVILEKENYVVRDVGTELGLLNRVEEYGIMADLILMDLTLKNESGFDLIQKLKTIEIYCNIPIIIVSEHCEKDKVVLARLAKVQGYLVKPIQAETLKKAIKEVFQGIQNQ